MTERIKQELVLLRRFYADLEYIEEGMWVRIPAYACPTGLWSHDEISVCFQIPTGFPGPGQAPYGFYVQPLLRHKQSGAMPQNYTEPAATPFPGDWSKFSWQHDNWFPTADLQSGSNLLNFVRTFRDRLAEGV